MIDFEENEAIREVQGYAEDWADIEWPECQKCGVKLNCFNECPLCDDPDLPKEA